MDLISRQAAIKFFTELWECIGTICDREEWGDVCMTTANEIPSAQPEGHWIHQNGDLYECSECGAMEHISPEWGYCPVCGAEMEGREE